MGKQQTRLSVFNRFILLLNHLAVIALLFSYLAYYISPILFLPIAFFGIAYPFILALNVLFILYWLINKQKYLWYSLIFIIIGWNHMGRFVQVTSGEKLPDGADRIEIMTYNVRMFGFYEKERNNTNLDGIFNIVSSYMPDVVCFQEYYSGQEGKTLVDDRLLSYPYHYTEFFKEQPRQGSVGLATYSKYPIVKTEKILLSNSRGNNGIYTDIIANNDTLRIFNIHLQSIYLSSEDYLFTPETYLNDTLKKDIKGGSLKLFRKLKNAFIKRAHQAKMLHEQIANSPHPVVVCGDFNDTPASYAYRKVSYKLADSFVESGKGIGTTYAGNFPSFRIDYILHSKDYTSYNYETIREKFSDHYPVYCVLSKKTE